MDSHARRRAVATTALLTLSSILLRAAEEPPSLPALPDPLSLAAAQRLALEHDPERRRLEALLEAADGHLEQAGLRPNPTIGAEIENVLGSGAHEGFERLEATVTVAQTIETGGKRLRREALARREQESLAFELERRRTDLAFAVEQAFLAVVLGEEKVALRIDQRELALASARETARLVEAAHAPAVELTRAQLAVHEQTFALEQARRSLTAARSALAALWGTLSAPEFAVEGAGTTTPPPPPALGALLPLLEQHPEVRRYASLRAAREAAVDLAEAEAKADLEVFAGARYFREESGEVALVFGVEMPWQLFDRNQGERRARRATVRALEEERAATLRTLQQRLLAAHATLVAAYEDFHSLDRTLRVAAEDTLSATREGYENGQYTLLAVLESRQALFAIREAMFEAKQRHAAARAEIATLTHHPESTLTPR